MINLYQTILDKILKHTLKGIPKFDRQVHPFYDGLSIANIPTSICHWLGCPLPVNRPLAEEISANLQQSYQHVIFVVVDGLGLEFLQNNHMDQPDGNPSQAWNAILNDSLLLPLTSIVPSTTSAALTTFWTGRLPAEHGIIGYELFLKEFGLIANMITHSVSVFHNKSGNLANAGFNPESFLPVPTLGSHFSTYGIQSFAFQHASIAHSGLSQMFLKETQICPYQSLEEMWNSVASIHQNHNSEKTFSYVYWGKLDTLSHHAGPNSSETKQQWQMFSGQVAKFVEQFNSSGKSDTLLILTADHGQISSDINPEYDLRNHPEFTQKLLMNPSGESRLPFLFSKPNREQELRDYLNNHWDSQFTMIPSEEVLASGLLGNCQPYQGTVDRLGNFVVFPKNDAYWWWASKENHLRGRHGGLSQEEMLVPFIALEI